MDDEKRGEAARSGPGRLSTLLSAVMSTSRCGNWNARGITPMTVCGFPFRLIACPSTPESPANADCHSP